jgi:ribosomal protein S21
MGNAFDNEESLTHEEVLRRFKKVMGREMTPEEKHKFFLPEPPDVVAERTKHLETKTTTRG